MRNFQKPNKDDLRINYLNDLRILARMQPDDIIYLYYDCRSLPQSDNGFSQRLIRSLKSEYKNISPVDLGDLESRQQYSAFDDEVLRVIDILVTAPTPNYGYIWDVVRLAHLSARDYAVPMDTDVKLLKKINIAKVEQICGSGINGISFCYNEANKQNSVMFSMHSQSEATKLAIIKLGNYFSEKNQGRLINSISLELLVLKMQVFATPMLSGFEKSLKEFADSFAAEPVIRNKIINYANQLAPGKGGQKHFSPEIFSAAFLRYGSYYQLDLESPGDWITLLVDRSIVGRKNEHVPDDFIVAVCGEAATIMASLVTRLKSTRDMFLFSPYEAAALFLIAFRINDAIFGYTCLALLDVIAGLESANKDSELLILLAYMMSTRAGSLLQRYDFTDYAHVFTLPASTTRQQAFLDQKKYGDIFNVESHGSWHSSPII